MFGYLFKCTKFLGGRIFNECRYSSSTSRKYGIQDIKSVVATVLLFSFGYSGDARQKRCSRPSFDAAIISADAKVFLCSSLVRRSMGGGEGAVFVIGSLGVL